MERLKAELESLKKSSQPKANSLSSALAEHDELKEHLYYEQERTVQLELEAEKWVKRDEGLPKVVVAYYVKTLGFETFLTQLAVGS